MLYRIPSQLIVEQPELASVGAFFDAIDDKKFLEYVDYLTRGIGAHTEKVHCLFPSDFDEYDIAHKTELRSDKIEFSFDWGEEAYVDISTFRRFLTIACDAHVKRHPEDRAKIEELLARPQPPLFQESSSPAT
jgi:hypothetical protein